MTLELDASSGRELFRELVTQADLVLEGERPGRLAGLCQGVPAGLVQNAEDIVTRDPRLAHRGHWIKLDHPETGNSIYNAGPFRSRRMPPGASRPAPLLGQHTQEVCAELLGLDAAAVADLQRSGVLA